MEISTTLLPSIRSRKDSIGYVLLNTDAMNPDLHQEAVDMTLDFLNDCKILKTTHKPSSGVVRFLIRHTQLPRVITTPSDDIPYYDVWFEDDGEYEFRPSSVSHKEFT